MPVTCRRLLPGRRHRSFRPEEGEVLVRVHAAAVTPTGAVAIAVRLRRDELGRVLSPAEVFAVLLLPAVGLLLGRGTDARWLVFVGLLLRAVGNYWLAVLNLDISSFRVVWPRVVLIVGLSMLFVPLYVAA